MTSKARKDSDKASIPLNSNNLKVPRSNGHGNHHHTSTRPVQPDGGWGWVVAFTSMATNGTVFGTINCFGILYVVMKDHYSKGDPNAAFKTSWVGSTCTGLTFFLCMLSSIVSDQLGIRQTAVVGGLFAAVGMLASAFVEELEILYLTYGIVMGFGFAFSYAPSLTILGHYFKKRIGLVNGLVTFGSSAFTLGLSLGLPKLLDHVGLKMTLIVMSGLNLLLVPYALTWRPVFTSDNMGASQAALSTMSLEMMQGRCTDCMRFTKKFLNVNIWRNKGYVVWAVSCGISLFGYFVPFVHIVQYVKDVFPEKDGQILIMCLSVTSACSRLLFGKLADLPWVNRIRMQQLAFLVMGVCTLCIPFSASFEGLIALTLIMGLCDGLFICLLGPIAFDIVGERGASQALGFLFGIFSIPMTVGPPIAGLLYDYMGNYNIAFHIAGCPPLLGGLLMFFIPKQTQRFGMDSRHSVFALECQYSVTTSMNSQDSTIYTSNEIDSPNNWFNSPKSEPNSSRKSPFLKSPVISNKSSKSKLPSPSISNKSSKSKLPSRVISNESTKSKIQSPGISNKSSKYKQ